MSPLEVVAAALMVTGAALVTVAGLGLVRLPDLWSRMHAATKPVTLGLVLVAAGTGLRLESWSSGTMLVLTVAITVLTAPVAAHLIGRAGRVAPRSNTSAGPAGDRSSDPLADPGDGGVGAGSDLH